MHSLDRYLRIVAGTARPRFQVARSTPADLPALAGECWKEHERSLEQAKGALDLPARERAEYSLLDLKVALTRRHQTSCTLCPWRCAADREGGQVGHCGVLRPKISSDFVHLGEEAPLVPSYTVFFSGCNLRCVFCQNYEISTRPDRGIVYSPEELAERLDAALRTSRPGRGSIRNINWVGGDPIPALPYILEVLQELEGNIAQIWNSNMYLEEESMRLLDGTMDIYLTDLKFGNDACARRLCGVNNYTAVVLHNHLLAVNQGEVLVRHLQLPGHLECCTIPLIDWLAENIPDVPVNLMAQYRPCHKAWSHRELRAPLSREEHLRAVDHARHKGLSLL
ncbi:MAG: radical SAM protein [Euryarchaeota archaeon]|nr:radical SAM protein [Euryarchaeota archaeon]